MFEWAKREGNRQVEATWVITCVSGILLLVHLIAKIYYGNLKDGLDVVSLGLIVFGLSPWIAKIMETVKVGGLELKFVQKQLEDQESDINKLSFLVKALVSKHEIDHLNKLNSTAEFIVNIEHFPDDFKRELRHLRDLGLIDNHPNTGINPLYKEEGQYKNLHKYFYITDDGKTYLKFRSELSGTNT